MIYLASLICIAVQDNHPINLKMFDLNVLGLLLLTKEAVKHFKNGGSIINISSIAASHPVLVPGANELGSFSTRPVASRCRYRLCLADDFSLVVE